MNRWFCLLLFILLTGCAVLPQDGQSENDAERVVAVVAQCVESNAAECVALPPQPLTEDDAIAADADLRTPTLSEDVAQPLQSEPLFDFPVMENDQVRSLLEHFTGGGRRSFTCWLQRSGRYLPMMREVFAREGLPQDLTILAMVESGFNSNAHSWANAVGHWQFIESTGKMYGLDNGWWYDERRDVEKATLAAAHYLKDLHRRFDGNWYLAVAAYNAGPGKISRAIKRYHTTDFWELSRGDYLKAETKNYIPKLLAALLISKQPAKYGFCDLSYEQPLEFDRVVLSEATDLELVAELTGASYAQLKALNPELKRWCTPPRKINYSMRVPVGLSNGFAEKYAAIPGSERARYKRHQIKSGDTLQHLAKRYGIRIDDIVVLNEIKNPRALQIGQNLILPLHRDFSSLPLTELADDYQRSRRRHYTIRSGDSLWSIARKCDVTQKQLRVWNRLGWSNIIQPGETLLVSSPGGKTTSRGIQQKMVYRVRSGDTLWDIGQRFAVQTGEIRRWNGLTENHIIHPGDKLTLLVRNGKRTS
ncbi:MAG: LysM peptidoglycan-binding domain-containing protein [Thermodesulfobacteriota bacterium]|nr:LysM peptidoglycan-binding domain-containing protein [Thermodesulfobacteriota bacterium]